MQHRFESEKKLEIYCEDGLERWFFNELFHAVGKGTFKMRKTKRSVWHEEKNKYQKTEIYMIERE